MVVVFHHTLVVVHSLVAAVLVAAPGAAVHAVAEYHTRVPAVVLEVAEYRTPALAVAPAVLFVVVVRHIPVGHMVVVRPNGHHTLADRSCVLTC